MRVCREARGPVAAMAEVRLQRPEEERIAGEERTSERFAVLRRPRAPHACGCAATSCVQMRRRQSAQRQVEPDEQLGALEHERAEGAGVVAVGDPAVERVERLRDAALELVLRRARPVRAVEERVELDVREAETFGDRAARRRLARAGVAGDADATSHGSKLARCRDAKPASGKRSRRSAPGRRPACAPRACPRR